MHPARFVTWCCLYCGGVLLATQALFYQSRSDVSVFWTSVPGLCTLIIGLYRLYSDSAETSPSTYGIVTAGMALVAIVVTMIFVAAFFTV